MLRLVDEGIDEAEIARRFRRSPEFVARVLSYTGLPRGGSVTSADPLRPLERRILKWRSAGAAPAEIAPRFRRSPGHIERVERLASYKQ